MTITQIQTPDGNTYYLAKARCGRLYVQLIGTTQLQAIQRALRAIFNPYNL